MEDGSLEELVELIFAEETRQAQESAEDVERAHVGGLEDELRDVDRDLVAQVRVDAEQLRELRAVLVVDELLRVVAERLDFPERDEVFEALFLSVLVDDL